jgi:two-component system response regulator TctD
VAFDPVAGHLTVGENVINLRNRELRLLELLISAPGQIFAKTKLIDRLFSYEEDVSENAVEVYIGRLRKHLENSGVSITTHRGLGYRLDRD